MTPRSTTGADVAASTRVVGKIVEFSAQDVAAMCLVASVTAAKAADALESEFQSKEHRSCTVNFWKRYSRRRGRQ